MAASSTDMRRAAGGAWLAAGAIVTAALWLFLSTTPWPDTPDGLFHLQRTRALAEALRQGVFYPRWFPDFAFGYGHPILHYYAPGYYLLPALLHLLGLDLITATRLALAALYGLSGAAAYQALRQVASAPAALVGALLTLAFPYRLYDLSVRGALPEFAAFLWPPLLLYGSLRVLRASAPWWRGTGALVLALAWAGLVLTHNLTALMAALVTVAAVPLVAAWPDAAAPTLTYVQRLVKTGLRLGLPALLGGLLSAFYSVPALLEASWAGIGASETAHGYLAHFAGWDALWQGALRYRYPSAADPVVPLPIYALPLLALAGGVLVWMRPRRPAWVLALLAALALLWLTTAASAPLWRWAAPLLGKLQFPWRWQTLLAPALGALAALLLDRLASMRRGSGRAWTAALGIGLLLFVYAAAIPTTPLTGGLQPRDLWAFDAAHGQVGGTWTGEFLPRWVSAPRWTLGRAPEAPLPPQPALALSAVPQTLGYLDAAYTVQAAAPLTVTLDRFYFPAWQVQVDGTPVDAFPSGELGLLAAALPAGDHQVEVRWGATPALWVGRAATTLGWLLLLGMLAATRLRLGLGIWLLVGLVALAGMTGILALPRSPAPVGADFGDVRLEAAEVAPVVPGDAAAVRVHWTATGTPAALIFYVHVLGEDGSVIAQWDEPLGTIYRAGRIQPGLLFSQSVDVPLPADLAAGVYRVVGGLYPAGAPNAPLAAMGMETPRVLLGALEVLR